MTRTVNRSTAGGAREKIVEAFWILIAKVPYDKITVAQIVREAGLNRNSFYYHFEDIDSMSRIAVAEVLDHEFLSMAFAQLHGQNVKLDFSSESDIAQRIDRMCLIASDNSSVTLRNMLRESMIEVWCDTLSINKVALSVKDRLALEFNLGGILALLAYRANALEEFSLDGILDSDLGQSIMANLENIGNGNSN